jgi:hypothetical protein
MALRTCTECGTVNPPERRFCSSCGSLLDVAGASTPTSPSSPEQTSGSAAEPQPAVPSQPWAAPEPAAAPERAAAPQRPAPQPTTGPTPATATAAANPPSKATPADETQPWAPRVVQTPEILTVKPPDQTSVAAGNTSAKTWTCPQCSNVNDWSRIFCSSCGYARGQEPSPARLPTQSIPPPPVVAPARGGPSMAVILAGIGAIALLAVGGIVIGGLVVGPKASQSVTPTQTTNTGGGGGGGGGGQTETPTETPAQAGNDVTIGDYSGQTPADVKAALAALCDDPQPCVSVVFAPIQSTDVGFRQVVGTDPGSGGTISKGGTVTVSVSVGDQSTDGHWFETTETNHTFSCIANRFGFLSAQLKDVNRIPGGDEAYNHYAPGDLIWIPGDAQPDHEVSQTCKDLGA